MKSFLKFGYILLVSFLLQGLYSCKSDQIAYENIDVSFTISNLRPVLNSKKDLNIEGVNPNNYPTCTDDKVDYIEVSINGHLYKVFMTSLKNNQTEVIQLNKFDNNIIGSFIAYNSDGIEIYSIPEKDSPEDNGKLTVTPMKLELRAYYKSKIKIDLVCWYDYSYSDDIFAKW